MELVFEAARVHRAWFDPSEMQLSQLLSVKTGGCAENCGYCSQSAHFKTGLKAEKLMEPAVVIAKAKAARAGGAQRFCMGAAWRELKDRDLPKLAEMIGGVKALGMETCATLGMLTAEQAKQLKDAGLDYYNHNLDTSPEFYGKVITTRTYQDRLDTLEAVRSAGINVCCGGILGMGETLEQRIDFAFELAELGPCEVPINLLDPRPGTPLADHDTMSAREALQAIALFRLILPSAWLRLAGGRERVLGELQGMGLLAGANALIVGNYLTTNGRPPEADHALLEALGMPVAEGPGEGRFVVDATGSHALPAKPVRTTIPVTTS